MAQNDRQELSEIVHGVRKYLSYLQSLPLEGVPAPAPAQKTSDPEDCLEALRARIGDCRRCRLSQKRTRLVFGVGNPRAELVFVGEAPGRDEDLQGEPFVGAAGQLLTKIIQAMGLQRQDVYICNVVKCWPPGNRAPAPDEIATCEPFLLQQIALIKPKVVVALGSVSAQALLKVKTPISRIRGRFHDWQGTAVMPTFHPAYLLRNPEMKKHVWDDMKKVMSFLQNPK